MSKFGNSERDLCMPTRTLLCGQDLSHSNGQIKGEGVPRRRGRPPQQIHVSIAHRAVGADEETAYEESIRLVIASIVRRRMKKTEEMT